ncbi:hypothetical protein [Nocardia pseudovaccinii]|nr:hypothetical protein [Nocardia pseudovaccinii]
MSLHIPHHIPHVDLETRLLLLDIARVLLIMAIVPLLAVILMSVGP